MNLAAVMEEIAVRLDTIAGLRVYAYPADQIQPPAAVVGYPETITYDVTMGRGVDRMEIPLFVLVARQTDRTARDELGPYLDGSGAESVKAVLKGVTWTAMSDVRVASVTVDVVTVAAVDYLAAVFSMDVYGPGG